MLAEIAASSVRKASCKLRIPCPGVVVGAPVLVAERATIRTPVGSQSGPMLGSTLEPAFRPAVRPQVRLSSGLTFRPQVRLSSGLTFRFQVRASSGTLVGCTLRTPIGFPPGTPFRLPVGTSMRAGPNPRHSRHPKSDPPPQSDSSRAPAAIVLNPRSSLLHLPSSISSSVPPSSLLIPLS
jgi:hypothetical protein